MRNAGTDRRHRRFAAIPGALVALAGLLALAGVSTAAKKLTTESESVSVASAEAGAGSPQCPGKKKAVSGGFSSEFTLPLGSTGRFLPIASLRGGRRGWESTMVNNSSTEDEFTAFAYCRKQKKVRSKLAETTVAGSGGGDFTDESLSVKCKKRQKVLSGGFDNPDLDLTGPEPRLLIAHESKKTGKRGWSVAAVNGSVNPGTLAAQANCYKGKRLKTRRASETLTAPAGEVAIEDVVAKCAKKQRLVSGGFSAPPIRDAEGIISHVFASEKIGKRKWSISGLTTGSREFTAYAYCEKRKG